jgi:hypothetical protein
MTRAQGWAAPYSFLMMYYLFLEKIYSNGSLQIIHEYIPIEINIIRFAVSVVPIVFLTIITIIDMKRIWPEEMGYSFERNPEWRDLKNGKV